MDERGMQRQQERGDGDKLIEWVNVQYGLSLQFAGRAAEAPDLEYRSPHGRTLRIEVTAPYYDGAHAKFLWENEPSWFGSDPDRKLANAIEKQIITKCRKDYGRGCILLVAIRPGGTSGVELWELIDFERIPKDTHFAGIYVAGVFPTVGVTRGGYRVMTICHWNGDYAC